MKKIFKFIWPTIALTPTLVLASCSSTISQYGINAKVISNYDQIATNDTEEMKKTFGNYFFNNSQISSASTLIDGNEFSNYGWQGVLSPLLLFFTGLTNIQLLLNNSTDKNNSIFQTTDDSLLTEFIYACKNVLSDGAAGQIKFGFTSITSSFAIKQTTEPTQKNTVNPQQTYNSVYAKSGDTLTVGTKENENSKSAYIDSNLVMTVQTELGYWYSENNNPTQTPISDINVIKKYVEKNNSWANNVEPKHTTFNLDFQLEISLRTIYSNLVNSFSKEEQPKTDQTNPDDNKPSIDYVSFAEEDFKNAKPRITILNYAPKSTASSLKGFDHETVIQDVADMGQIISSNKANQTDVQKYIDKYKNVLILTAK